MVEPSLTGRSLISHTDYISARVIVSSATHITENQVFTADGGSFTFDYLVVATGHAYSTPRGRDDRIKEFQLGKCLRSLQFLCFHFNFHRCLG